MSNLAAPKDGNYNSELAGLSPSNGWAAIQLGATTGTDSATGNPYAPVVTQALAPTAVSATLQSAAAATGAGTALTVTGDNSVAFTVTGTFVGTITWQGSEDGTNYSSIFAVQLGTNTISTTATTTGTYEASCSGLTAVRANITGYTSGAITVTAHAVPGSFTARSINANLLAGSNVIGAATIQATSGTALTADQTNSILKTSLYGKNAAAADTAIQLDGTSGAVRVVTQGSANAVTGSATAAVNTAFATATLPAVSAKTNYITGFSVTTQGGSAAAAGVVTITGTITGTLNYQVGAAANNPVTLIVNFHQPIPASAANTAIVVNVPTLGVNTGAVAATIYGFTQ